MSEPKVTQAQIGILRVGVSAVASRVFADRRRIGWPLTGKG